MTSPKSRPPKGLRRLLPGAAGISSTSPSSSPGQTAPSGIGPILQNNSLPPKRVTTSIACDRCRTKKIRCDGMKPRCSACLQKGIPHCRYEEPATIKNGVLVEAIGLLNSLTPAEANLTLLKLVDVDRDAEIIATLRDVASITSRSSADVHETSTSFARMLEAKHPFTYPVFEPIDPKGPSDHLKRLVNPIRKSYYHNENMPSKLLEAPEDDTQVTTDARQIAPAPRRTPRDPALDGLDMSRWTTVLISNDTAARAISLYLTTDHLLLCPFDRKLFITSLVSPDTTSYCKPALVNALMYWCCQTYASIEPEAGTKAELFRQEAESLWEVEKQPCDPLDMTVGMFLSLGYLVQGKDHASIRHLSKASEIGRELGLFGVPEEEGKAMMTRMTPQERISAAFPVWGVFNWIVLMSLFYRQQGIVYPDFPPVLLPPLSEAEDEDDNKEIHDASTETIEGRSEGFRIHRTIFARLCRFWEIMHEVAAVYYGDRTASLQGPISLEFAEFRYREILAWADNLPVALARSGRTQDIVIILHLWMHSAILDIFRPFLTGKGQDLSTKRLKTFPSSSCTPEAAYSASVRQLKQLIITYRTEYTSSNYTIIWQTALLYTANAMLRSTDEDRLEYFLICIYSFQGLRQSFRVTAAIVKALLSMAMQEGIIGGQLAQSILMDLNMRAPKSQETEDEDRIRAPFMADLDLSMTNPDLATAEQQSEQFDANVNIGMYTVLFDHD